jgi:hypothetical protein
VYIDLTILCHPKKQCLKRRKKEKKTENKKKNNEERRKKKGHTRRLRIYNGV